MAKAVVDAAKKRKLDHEEMHSKVEYIVAHGISTTIEGKKAIIGSSHFVFEDEKCTIPEGMEEKFKNLPNEYSHLYLAIEGSLAAVICIEDPLREEAPAVVKALKKAGFSKVVMMTGDSERTARAVAARSALTNIILRFFRKIKQASWKKRKQKDARLSCWVMELTIPRHFLQLTQVLQ